jgi:hypothetical protein
MLHLYLLYACVYTNPGKHASKAATTRCVEQQVFLDVDHCKKKLPEGGKLTERGKHERRWSECKETTADAWVPPEANDRGDRLYKLQIDATDANALATLLAPLSPEARATLHPEDFKRSFQRAFQGPGSRSFFIVGNGSKVIAYALTGLNDFQFTDVATDVSSSAAATPGDDLDFGSIAQSAGLELTYQTETLQRDMPPPGGVEVGP